MLVSDWARLAVRKDSYCLGAILTNDLDHPAVSCEIAVHNEAPLENPVLEDLALTVAKADRFIFLCLRPQ
jgi:hypothetical protein